MIVVGILVNVNAQHFFIVPFIKTCFNVGICQSVMFNEVFPIIFGEGTDMQTVLSKVLCDSLVITPFICLPVAYLVKR